MTLIKICGVNSPEAFAAVIQAEADYLGFVFFERSPRFVTGLQAAALSEHDHSGPKRVGLFVEPQPAEIRSVLETVKLDVLQVYGSATLCQQLRATFGLPVWRAIGVAGQHDLPADAQGLDGFVIEAKPPAGATRPGGNATAMDWSLLSGWKAPAPWLLGGGLNLKNVEQALRVTQAPGVDVSSGVETAPGQKSAALIHEFVTKVRNSAA